MGLQFGIFDHIEPVPGLSLTQIYRERLHLLERYDAAGFHAYHLAEHHTPAVHSLAPSQNVFLAAAGPLVAFGTGDGRVFRSLDAGRHWELAAKGLPPVSCLVVN